MKTWKENNWFTRLDGIYGAERLAEAEREITSRSLLPHNIDKFPELYDALFPKEENPLSSRPYYVPSIDYFKDRLDRLSGISGCRSNCKSTYESFIETIYPRLLNNFIRIVTLQVGSRRRAAYDLVKENLRYKTIRSFEKDYLEATNVYTKDPKRQKWIEEEYEALAHAIKFKISKDQTVTGSESYKWIDPIDPGESTNALPNRERAFFIHNMKYLGISDSDLTRLKDSLGELPNEVFVDTSESSLDRIGETLISTLGKYLNSIKDSVIRKGCKEISKAGGSKEDEKKILFDFRKEEICINTDCNLIGVYLKKPDEGYRKGYKCDAFVKGLPSLGDSDSVVTERMLCSAQSALQFNSLCEQLKIDKNMFTNILPEDVYSGLLEHPVYLAEDAHFKDPDDEFSDDRVTDINTFEGYNKSKLPAMAVRAAEYTAGLFSSKLGGMLILDDNNNLFLKKGKTLLTLQQARAMWRDYYKADVLYLYDHPTKTYSDGTPAKTYIPVQVKYVPTYGISDTAVIGKSAQLGHMKANARLLKGLVKPALIGMTAQDRDNLAAQVASFLLYGNYFLVTNSWKRWCYLPMSEDLYKREYKFIKTTGEKEYKDEFTIPLNNSKGLGAADVKMRVANRLESNGDGNIVLEIFPTGIRWK